MGGSAKKSGGRTPVEAPESGRSKQKIKIIEVISEGEIEGLVAGEQSIFFDNTPIQAIDGSYNFKNVSWQGRNGSQVQEPLDGFSAAEKEVAVGVEIKKNTPLTRTITDSKVNRVRLHLGVSSLFSQSDNGDTNGSTVNFKITVGNQSPQMLQISGKYSSQYLRQFELSNLPSVPFTIKVERVEPDSTSQRLQNKTLWASYTEIIDSQFAYPNSALIGIAFDSEYFSSIPNRTYDLLGIRLKVPSNYDSVSRTYSGLWDGTFKIAWSNNPAWVLYDLLTNKRYGLGQRLGEFGVDKWALYQVANYCDQMIPDGFGGTEPRFTCNAWLTEQRSAYDVIHDICSIFRAMPVWNGTEMTVIMDRPQDPVWTYTNANVIDGEFTRSYSAIKSRANAVQVEYKDAANNFETTIEYVADDEAIRKYGLNLKKVVAFGCTSRGQAHRTGLWILKTEQLETETITFSVGSEGLMHIPGDIIRVSDNHYAGTEIGGRVLAVEGLTVTLDRPITLSGSSFFSYFDNQAKAKNIRIVAVNGNQITLADNPTGLEVQSVWSLTTQQITSRLYRAMSISEEDGKYTITALQHEPQKEAIVDNGATFEPVTTTLHKAPKVENLVVESVAGGMRVRWNTTSGEGVVKYDLKILKDGRLYAIHQGLTSLEMAFDDLPDGDYTVIITARNARGQLLNEKTQTFTVSRPPVPTEVQISSGLSDITLSWKYVDDFTQTEIWASETNQLSTAKRVAKVLANIYTHTLGASQTRYYWLRHTRGKNVGAFYQQQGLRGETSVDIAKELAILNAKLKQPIINEVFDTAAPARGLELIKTVNNLPNPTAFLGVNLVMNQTDRRLYKWNGQRYEFSTPASEISGQVLPSQLAQIPTEKLTGQLNDNQIRTISAMKVQGQLVDSQIQAVNVAKLQGAIQPTQLAPVPTSKLSGQVSAAQIQANAVGANHIAAGVLTADKFAVGLGGNLLPNPIFANNGYGWSKASARLSGTAIYEFRGQRNLDFWLKDGLENEHIAFMRLNHNYTTLTTGQWADVAYINQKVSPGKWYIFSAYFKCYRSAGCLQIEKYSEDFGAYQGVIARSGKVGINGGNDSGSFLHGLRNAPRHWVKFQAPETGSISIRARAYEFLGNYPDVYFARPMLEECTEYTQEPSPWQNSGVTTIHGGSLVTDSITGDKIRANEIQAVHLQANSVDTSKLRANSITSNHIVSASIITAHLATGSVNTDKLAANSVDASKIRSNSIATNHLQANIINAGHLQANSVATGHLQAGAVRANHVAAGELTADKLAIGLGGNLLYNPIFANPVNGVPDGWSIEGNASITRLCVQDPDWGLKRDGYQPNENILRYKTQNDGGASSYGGIRQLVPVNAGQWYMFSAYLGNHRCAVELHMQFLDSNNRPITSPSYNTGSRFYSFAGINQSVRAMVKGQAPSNAVKAWLYIRKKATVAGSADSFLFAARPMLEECTEHTQEPSPWQNAGVTAIHGGSIVTETITAQQIGANAITANKIVAGAVAAHHIAANSVNASHLTARSVTADKMQVSSLSAVSSNLGNITGGSLNINNRFKVNTSGQVEMRSASNNVGLVMNNDQIIVYDERGRVRVKIGRL